MPPELYSFFSTIFLALLVLSLPFLAPVVLRCLFSFAAIITSFFK